MRALITGAGGFVGRYLAAHCIASGDEVALTGREGLDALARSLPGAAVRELDVCDERQVARAVDELAPDVIYHLAALTFLPQVEKERKSAFDVNVGGTVSILEAARAKPNVRVLIVSSAQIYAPSSKPIAETGALIPGSFYGMTKRMAEEVSGYYAAQGVAVMIARPFNHSGPGQRSEFVLPSFAKQIVEVERGTREAKIQVGNLNAVRDFLDVRDVVRAYRELAMKGAAGELYNVCSGEGRSIMSALEGMVGRARVKVAVEVDPARLRAGDAVAMVGDATKIRAATGWKAEISIGQMLDDLLEDARGRV